MIASDSCVKEVVKDMSRPDKFGEIVLKIEAGKITRIVKTEHIPIK
jgi:hypothetical protein